jgi:ubiquinone/menaquinone biosynthesis C-methylase UbiE
MAGGPRRRLALFKYRLFAPIYDRTAFYRRYLPKAVGLLGLRPGEVVLDVGCGTGLNFSRILHAIGPQGRLIGIDQSPDMLKEARRRCEIAGWNNVMLIASAVEDAEIPSEANAALFSFVHDIMRTPAALENVVSHITPAGRVVSVGMKRAPMWAVPVNLVAFLFLALGPAMTTLEGLGEPWNHLERLVADLHVDSVSLGLIYFASAVVS